MVSKRLKRLAFSMGASYAARKALRMLHDKDRTRDEVKRRFNKFAVDRGMKSPGDAAKDRANDAYRAYQKGDMDGMKSASKDTMKILKKNAFDNPDDINNMVEAAGILTKTGVRAGIDQFRERQRPVSA